jgi:PKD repeat protein
MSQKLGPFEENVQQVMEHFELPYVPSAWSDMEQRLNRRSVNSYSWVAAMLAAAVFTSSAIYIYYEVNVLKSTASGGWKSSRFEHKVNVRPSTSASDSAIHGLRHSELSQTSSIKVATSENEGLALVSWSNKGISADSPTNETSPKKSSNVGGGNSGEAPVVNGTSVLGIKANVSSACAGTTVDFNAANGPSKGSYLWNFGDGHFSSKPNPQHSFAKPGVYDVSLSVTNLEDGQIRTKVMDDFIRIQAAPKADFEWQFVNGPTDEPTVKLVNTSENAHAFEWRFEDGTTSQAISPVLSYNQKGKHAITLEVTNEQGCKDVQIAYISIENDFNLGAPEKFTPGKDMFMPESLKQGKQNFKLTIYNGAKAIFESSNKNKGWNGKLPDGSYAASAQQFPWIVIIKNEATNEEKYYSGLLTVFP